MPDHTTTSAAEEADYLKVEMDEAVQSMNRQARSRARRAVNAMRNSALEILRGDRHGRTYKLPNKKATYVASAPGEAPAVRTGVLRTHWRQLVLGRGKADGVEITARLKSDMPYSDLLDEGTPGGKIAPRPYKQKIIDDAKPKVIAIYGKHYLS